MDLFLKTFWVVACVGGNQDDEGAWSMKRGLLALVDALLVVV